MRDDHAIDLALDTLNDRPLDPQYPSPYPRIAHAVLRTLGFLTFDKPET